LELTVLDAKSRKPVTGLTADDFVVKVNGVRQRLVALSEGTARRDAAGPTTSFPGVTRDVADNSRVAQRLFVILMNDAVSTNDPVERQNGKEIARRVVDALGPDDLAAVVFCRNNRHAQDFTPDRAPLRAAIDTFNPVPAIYQAPILNNVVRFLSEVPGVRRSVVYISATGGLATTRADRLADIVGLIDDGSLPFTIGDISGIGTARGTSASHIPVYLFHTTGLKAPSLEDVAAGRVRGLLDPSVEDTFRSVAAMTGGRAVWANNAPAELVPAMFEELWAYYILGFEPDYPLDGRLRWLQVELKRPGLVVYPSNVPLFTPRDAL
jgi:VWFA-related protein